MPFIKRDFITSLSDKVDIISTIGKRITLTKKGRDYKACCPFHQEKTPSFSVSAEKQAFYCFGCGEGGHALSFVQKFDNLDFIDAVERLSEENNIKIEYDKEASPIDKNIENLKALNIKVNNFYTNQLRNSPAKQKVIDYAKNRGISGAIAKRFKLGFAPPGWDNLYQHFSISEIDIKNLLTLGLIVKNSKKQGQYYDRFRDRLIFPIHNGKSQVVGFGGRVLSNEDTPKYLNSSQSPIFDKSLELYGLDLSRKHTRKIDYLLVVEGYMDVVALHEGGITCCVATLGTATTSWHIKTLGRNSRVIIFCFDGDNAGFNAAIKALKTSLSLITTDMAIKFLFLPDGEDPDSLIKKEGRLKFEERINNATTLSEFLFSHLKEKLNFTTIEGKTEFLQKSGILIADVNYGIYQEQLIQGLALEVGQSVGMVRKTIKQSNKIIINEQNYNDDDIVGEMKQTVEENTVVVKNHLSKIITLILKHPCLGTDELNTKIKTIPNTEILQKIIDIAAFEGANTTALINSFKAQTKIYQRLLFLIKNSVKMTENDSKKELKNSLNALLDYNKQQQKKLAIQDSNNISNAEQEALMIAINKKKLK